MSKVADRTQGYAKLDEKITYWKGGQEYNKLITKGKLVVLPKAMIHQYKVKEGGKIFVLKSLYCKNMEDDKVEKDVDFIF